jgi:hypothetical protein
MPFASQVMLIVGLSSSCLFPSLLSSLYFFSPPLPLPFFSFSRKTVKEKELKVHKHQLGLKNTSFFFFVLFFKGKKNINRQRELLEWIDIWGGKRKQKTEKEKRKKKKEKRKKKKEKRKKKKEKRKKKKEKRKKGKKKGKERKKFKG